MIIIAIVRISGFRLHKADNIVWETFWHQAEASVALITVSITAFRSLLGIKALKAREKKKRERSWFSNGPKLLARYLKIETQIESKLEQLPAIPGATLTGMRSFIHGDEIWDESRAIGMTHKLENDWPGAVSYELYKPGVADQISTKSDNIDGKKRAREANFV